MRNKKSYEINMFSRTKYDFENVPSFRGQDLSQQRLWTERARLREEGCPVFTPKRKGWGAAWREKRKPACWVCVCVYVLFILKIKVSGFNTQKKKKKRVPGFVLVRKKCFYFYFLNIVLTWENVEASKVSVLYIYKKYCADVEKCGSFKGLGFIYIYIYW